MSLIFDIYEIFVKFITQITIFFSWEIYEGYTMIDILTVILAPVLGYLLIRKGIFG